MRANANASIAITSALVLLIASASLATGCRTAAGGGKAAATAPPAALLITAQHKDAAAWGRTVTQMRTWGTPIQDEDQTALVAYLTQHFGQTAAAKP
jgi:hypothetical protein